MIDLSVNDQERSVDADPDTPLLWVLRDRLGLTGTKYGCGIGACGACTVLVDGVATRSCVTPAGTVAGKRILTIEGALGQRGKAVQAAWVRVQVPQCGYCQSGMILSAMALLARNPKPTRDEVRAGITNLCRCGTYQRVEDAVLTAADALAGRT
jgi:isoquinoline 1-oxidoreductase alpha subunit